MSSEFPNDQDPALRNLDDALQSEIEAALGDMSLMEMVDSEEAQDRAKSAAGIRRGRVVAIQKDDIFVELGGKDQGVLPATQFDDEPLPNIGDVIEFTVVGYDERDGLLELSRKGAVTAAAWDSLNVGQIVEGRVKGHNKGGLEMDINGIKGFMPISQIDRERVDAEELSPYVNRKLPCEVVEIRRAERSIVVSHRNFLDKQAAEEAKKTLASLVEGDVVRGTVKTVMPYGAFVDIGGTDGLLHVADMSHRRVEDPNEIVKQGQALEVKILKIDREQNRIALGLKQVMPDPWADADMKWPVDTLVTGRVSRLMDFGAFVELEEGVEGLVPISEMTFERRISHPREIVNEGEMVKVRVLNVDLEQRRIGLSLKRAGDDPWLGASVRWSEGSVVEGAVTRVTEFGAFVELTSGVEGLVHISELSSERVRMVSDIVRPGKTIQAKVLSVDEAQRRMSLSIKQLKEMPEYTGSVQPATESEPARPQKKRKKPLKGGLDW